MVFVLLIGLGPVEGGRITRLRGWPRPDPGRRLPLSLTENPLTDIHYTATRRILPA